MTAAAEQAIEQYGNGKAFKLEEATKDIYFVDKNKKERWLMSIDDRNSESKCLISSTDGAL